MSKKIIIKNLPNYTLFGGTPSKISAPLGVPSQDKIQLTELIEKIENFCEELRLEIQVDADVLLKSEIDWREQMIIQLTQIIVGYK